MTIEPPMHHVHDRALAIAELLGTYRHLTVDDAFRSKGLVKLATSIQQAVDRDDPVQIVLPAFAFKSPNQSKKTLGVLPDKAEEIALGHLQGLAENVARIYDKGAQITVVSDGLVYNGEQLYRGKGWDKERGTHLGLETIRSAWRIGRDRI